MDKKPFVINENGEAIFNDEIYDHYIESKYKTINIPHEYWGYTIEDFNIRQDAYGNELSIVDRNMKTKAKDFVIQYIDNLNKILNGEIITIKNSNNDNINVFNIIFCGGKSSGKTLLASAVTKEAASINLNSSFFFSWYYILDGFMKYHLDPNSISETQEIESLFKNKQIVTIDGINNKNYDPTNAFKRKFEAMMEYRSTHGKVTIFTTTNSYSELINMFGPVTQRFIQESIFIYLPQGDTTFEPKTY